MLRPDIEVTMSPGLLALPPGRFSHAGTMTIKSSGRRSRALALSAPRTLAAPHMSNFISSMPSPGLSEMPPESKVMPLPIRTSGLALLPFVFLPSLPTDCPR